MATTTKKYLFLFLLLFLSTNLIYAARITGTVTDASSGNSLIGANVIIVGTSLGSATDPEGEYTIVNVPVGEHIVRFSYIGYNAQADTITITSENQTLQLNVELSLAVIEGDEITVTAQAEGQLAAINQQLSADAMVNIVDAAKIQELPDQNVAEAIGRLPGVTVSRNDGEGAGIGIRGLAPQYNQVQIDGVVMSSSANMGAASDYQYNQGRSVNLSYITQENLSGIEVFKSITPDMDAATLGGTVNMRLGKAPTRSIYETKVYGAYNAYQDDWSNYKIVARGSERFFDNSFGVQLSINAERRNRGSDRLNGNIKREDIFVDSLQTRITQYRTLGATIQNTRRIREKRGLNAIFDYSFGQTDLLFSNFFTLGKLNEKQIRRDGSNLSGDRISSDTYSISNALRGTHNISNLEIEWQVSHFETTTETPDDYGITFGMKGEDATELNDADKIEITPEEYIGLLPDDGQWGFNTVYKDEGSISESKNTAKLDLTYPFFYGEVSGYYKTGFLVRQLDRTSRLQQRSLHNGRFPEGAEGPVYSEYTTDYNPDPVLNGNVSIRHFLDVDKIQPVWTDWIQDYPYSAYHPLKTANQNYDYLENFYAGYFMMKINAFNNLLTFIPGVRYEGNDFEATGYYHYIANRSTITVNGVYEPRTAERSHGFWLPMVHLKLQPAEWFDTRLSITKTISRPNFRYLIPYTTANFATGTVTDVGNPDLKTTESWNYDLSFSIYDSQFGLLTVSGFYKELTNFSYELTYYLRNNEDVLKYGLDPEEPAYAAGHYFPGDLNKPVNTHGLSTVKGIEIEYQANLRFLPGLLKNITFNINYTRAWSHSYLRQYEVTLDSISYLSEPPWVQEHRTYNIGFRSGRLPTQPDHLLNVSLGYDIGGFSGRVSAFFQGRSLASVGRIEAADTYIQDYLRYDMSLRYRFNDNFSILVTGVNLNSEPDITRLSGSSKNSRYAVFGAMYDFGVQYSF